MLHVFYTGGIRGDLDLLPPLYTYLRSLQAVDSSGQLLLLDQGGACAPEVWHCAVTGGRSTLIVLDAMGYHAARVNLSAEARARLEANLLGVALVDAEQGWQAGEVLVTAEPATGPHHLNLVLQPAAATGLDGRTLFLQAVSAGQVGVALLDDTPALLRHTIHHLPPHILPDPTITAAVDFVLAEARALQRRQNS